MIRFIKRIVYCFASLLTFLLLMYLVAFCVGEPELNKDRYIKLYDDQNEIFYQSINNYSGQYVSLENVSPYFLKAIVSIEDKRFYQHHGFDYVGISRAIKTNVIKGKIPKEQAPLLNNMPDFSTLLMKKPGLVKLKKLSLLYN